MMSTLQPIPTELNLKLNNRHRKEGKKRIDPVKNPKSSEVKYRKTLLTLTKKIQSDINTQILPLLRSLEFEYVSDGYATAFQIAFQRLQNSYEDLNTQAQFIARAFVYAIDKANRDRFNRAVKNSIGVNLEGLVKTEGLEDVLQATVQENVNLIVSIAAQYLKNVESIVYTGTVRGNSASSMIRLIQKAGKTTASRAKLIARDQTSKLNSAITQQRSQALGATEYVWRTSGDEGVRKTHRENNGKTFRWDDPPKKTGHPGEDILCRCIAQPVINLN